MEIKQLTDADNPDVDALFKAMVVKALTDFLGCLMTGLIAAAPCFLEAFMKCLAGGNGAAGDFKPGNRPRC